MYIIAICLHRNVLRCYVLSMFFYRKVKIVRIFDNTNTGNSTNLTNLILQDEEME